MSKQAVMEKYTRSGLDISLLKRNVYYVSNESTCRLMQCTVEHGYQDVILDMVIKKSAQLETAKHNHRPGNTVVSKGDVTMAKMIQEFFPKAKLYIVFPNNQSPPIEYDCFTTPGTLPEVICRPD